MSIVRSCAGIKERARRFVLLADADHAYELPGVAELDTGGLSQCRYILTKVVEIPDQDYTELMEAHMRDWKVSPLHLIGSTLVLHDAEMLAPPKGFVRLASSDPDVQEWLAFRVLQHYRKSEAAAEDSLWNEMVRLAPGATRAWAEEHVWVPYKQFKKLTPARYRIFGTPYTAARVADFIHTFYGKPPLGATTANPFDLNSGLRLNCIGRTALMMAMLERLGESDSVQPYFVASNDWFKQEERFGHTWMQFEQKELGPVVIDLVAPDEPLLIPLEQLKELQALRPDRPSSFTSWLLGRPYASGLRGLRNNWYATLRSKGQGIEGVPEAEPMFDEDSGDALPGLRTLNLSGLLQPRVGVDDGDQYDLWHHVQRTERVSELFVEWHAESLLLRVAFGLAICLTVNLLLKIDLASARREMARDLTEPMWIKIRASAKRADAHCRAAVQELIDRPLPEYLSFLAEGRALRAERVLAALSGVSE